MKRLSLPQRGRIVGAAVGLGLGALVAGRVEPDWLSWVMARLPTPEGPPPVSVVALRGSRSVEPDATLRSELALALEDLSAAVRAGASPPSAVVLDVLLTLPPSGCEVSAGEPGGEAALNRAIACGGEGGGVEEVLLRALTCLKESGVPVVNPIGVALEGTDRQDPQTEERTEALRAALSLLPRFADVGGAVPRPVAGVVMAHKELALPLYQRSARVGFASVLPAPEGGERWLSAAPLLGLGEPGAREPELFLIPSLSLAGVMAARCVGNSPCLSVAEGSLTVGGRELPLDEQGQLWPVQRPRFGWRESGEPAPPGDDVVLFTCGAGAGDVPGARCQGGLTLRDGETRLGWGDVGGRVLLLVDGLEQQGLRGAAPGVQLPWAYHAHLMAAMLEGDVLTPPPPWAGGALAAVLALLMAAAGLRPPERLWRWLEDKAPPRAGVATFWGARALLQPDTGAALVWPLLSAAAVTQAHIILPLVTPLGALLGGLAGSFGGWVWEVEAARRDTARAEGAIRIQAQDLLRERGRLEALRLESEDQQLALEEELDQLREERDRLESEAERERSQLIHEKEQREGQLTEQIRQGEHQLALLKDREEHLQAKLHAVQASVIDAVEQERLAELTLEVFGDLVERPTLAGMQSEPERVLPSGGGSGLEIAEALVRVQHTQAKLRELASDARVGVEAASRLTALAVRGLRETTRLAQVTAESLVASRRTQLLPALPPSLRPSDQGRALTEEEAEYAHACAWVTTDPNVAGIAARACKSLAPLREAVMILGESGTGKESLAAGIHRASGLPAALFFSVNCAQLGDENTTDAYLFGVGKGLNQPARPGLFSEADGGTLFLDEVNSLPKAAQGKLLRVIEQGTYNRLGDPKVHKVAVRLICGGHLTLLDAVAGGTFREDLYYRVSALRLDLPALRDRRPSDLDALCEHFIQMVSKTLGRQVQMTSGARERLRAYGLPGNVRQLKNLILRAAIGADGGEIDDARMVYELSREPAGGQPGVLLPQPRSRARVEWTDEENQELTRWREANFDAETFSQRTAGGEKKIAYSTASRNLRIYLAKALYLGEFDVISAADLLLAGSGSSAQTQSVILLLEKLIRGVERDLLWPPPPRESREQVVGVRLAQLRAQQESQYKGAAIEWFYRLDDAVLHGAIRRAISPDRGRKSNAGEN